MLTNQFFAYFIFTFLVLVDISYCLNDFRCPRQILGIFAVDESTFWEADNIPYEGPLGSNTPSRFWAPNQIFLERTRPGVTTNRVIVSCVQITPDVLAKSGRRRDRHNFIPARIFSEIINGVTFKDHAGHIIAHKLGGSYHDQNIISQNPNCNTGYWSHHVEGIIDVSANYAGKEIYYGVKATYAMNDKNDFPTRPVKLDSKIFIKEGNLFKLIGSSVVKNPPPSNPCKIICNDLFPVDLKYLDDPQKQCKRQSDQAGKCWASC
ncbi:uncharacterized protein LOC113558924 [Rhopalosiphum maidis]|uniref:uncharacterized protein LOC113558924 n=1 Tax=Rhopalosiphum maidis TaxID=43146 RepID=UPI000F00249C|nr:uncharacterized protein LOC113558924 [Rhopalosiphum maidis]